MIDEEHRDLYMFASAPCCDGGAIYYKKTALANISFPEGVGTPFIQSATDTHINDATSTKQNVNSDTGLLVQASDDTSQFYVHNIIDLSNTSDTTPPETTIDSGPSGTVNSSSASFAFSSTEPDSTFECALDGASFSGCNSSQNYTELSDGSHTFQVRATDTASNTDTTPAERSWTVDTTGTVDTTAPLVESVTPADGAMNVAVANNIEASFSEAMDASTLTTSTFTLLKQDSTTTPVEAAVSYDSANKKATLDPASDLEANTSYTARVTGGSSGAKDLAGNALAQDYSWTFITASPPAPSCTITGTANAETISGTSSDDVICAGGGNDTINGLGGNDTLKGEAGGDTLLGDVGNDTLDGGLGIADTASYSVSLTAVTASLVTNSATGEGSDTFLGVENLIGSSQADTLTGSDTNNRLTGRGGPDTEQGGLGNDTVVGSGGADSLYGEDGDDTVNSQDSVSGNDSLDGGGGTDTAVTDATEKSIVNFP
jgi:Ca2+-binding RTX toxin-like protein